MVWKENDSEVRVQRIFLSDLEKKSEIKARDAFTTIELGSSSIIEALGSKILQFLKGDKINFDLQLIDFDQCFRIQKKVLLAEYDVPRGWVSTYKRIANKIGIPKGARVVGNALAKNPFPIVIPCHRAIKSNGELGGFQGGIEMKRALLEMEGIEFSNRGKVTTNKIYY
ncbi:MAG: MGMT family protein [Candidatus Lokiarchaeota archaeon]|nr:MGMT family protein [Candidatus Lokiarchaeota archaeon]